MLFGANVRNLEPFQFTGAIKFGSAIITSLQIGIIVTSIVVLILLVFLMKGTKIGKAMRAVADNKETAEIIGINSEKIYAWSMVIGSVVAGIAGVLIGLEQNLTPTMGTYLVVKSFAGVVIGGIGSISGAVLGSFLLGLIENVGIWFLPSGYQDAITFAVLFIFLVLRPQGILGIKNILSK
jgi:branched-chain amino acid transport system permease protein